MKISEAAKIGNFAADMILVGIKDLKHPDTTVEAALWFFGPDYGLWAEVAGIPFVDPLTIIQKQFTVTHARNLRAKIQRIIYKYQFVEVLGEDSGYSRKDVVRLAGLIMKTLDQIVGKPKPRERTKGKTPRQYWRIAKEKRNVQFATKHG